MRSGRGSFEFVAELKQWIRFSSGEAVEMGDGLDRAASGSPSVPRWLGSPMFKARSENDKCAGQTLSSAGFAVFVSAMVDKQHWIEAGRCYERFALQATALGIRNAIVNQAVKNRFNGKSWQGFCGSKAESLI